MPMDSSDAQFVLCVSSGDHPASLEMRKVYRLIANPVAEAKGLMRVIDESHEDYLFPSNLFVPVALSASTVEALLAQEAA